MDLPIVNTSKKTGISLSALAAEKVLELLQQRSTPEYGLRLGVSRRRLFGQLVLHGVL